MEDINHILTAGEIPNLFTIKDDLGDMRDKLRKDYLNKHMYIKIYYFYYFSLSFFFFLSDIPKDKKLGDEELFEFFLTRVSTNFHIALLLD